MGSRSYGYRPLGDREFRVLLLNPGINDEDLSGTLEHVSLDDEPKPQYETTSYACGDASIRAEISVNGKTVNIPASTAQVLRRVRSENSIRRLWIDAVCIDQQDLAERGHHVAFMSKIYSGGTTNLIWLGESDEDTALAFQCAHAAYIDFEKQVDGVSSIRRLFLAMGTACDGPMHSSLDFQAFPIRNYEVLSSIYSRAWFSRVWVIQEAALSPTNICFCGEYELPLSELMALLVHFWICTHQHTLAYSIAPSFIYATGVFGMAYRGHPDETRRRKISLPISEVLMATQTFQASIPHDRVFALLGLLQLRDDSVCWSLLQPDYTISPGDVFANASRAVLVESSTALLREIDHTSHLSVEGYNRPSWVLDLLVKPDGLYIFDNTTNASYGLPIHQLSHKPSSILVIAGLYIDPVSSVGPLADKHTLWREFVNESQDVVRCNINDPRGRANTLFHRAFARTLVANRLEDRTSVPGNDLDDFLIWLRALLAGDLRLCSCAPHRYPTT